MSPGTEGFAAIVATGLVKRFGALCAVDHLDLSVGRGECFGLLGPNGAGKTTTVEMLEGLTSPDEGQIQVLGAPWESGRRGRRLRSRLGVALQETRLPEKLTVLETVRLFRSFYRHGRGVDEVIGLLGLEEKVREQVGRLSGGQRQRLSLAVALVAAPELLFLDEPTTGLDPQARRRIWEVIHRFREEGGTVFLTTHYMDEAYRLCDRVAIMDRGRGIACDSPDALIATLGANQVIECVVPGLSPDQISSQVPGVVDVDAGGELMRVRVADLAASLPPLLDLVHGMGLTLESLSTRQATLEDVYIKLTGRELRDG